MKRIRDKENITKIYVTSQSKLTDIEVGYIIMSNKCFPITIKKLGLWNYIAEIEFPEHQNLLDVINTTTVRNKTVAVKRVFKSMMLSPSYKEEHSKSFLIQIIMGISGLIKKPVNIKITNNRADKLQLSSSKMAEMTLEAIEEGNE